MGFSRLSFNNLRNLQSLELRGLREINVIHGANGSGKTSILEGIYLLGVARSFRSPKIRNVITHGCEDCTAFGEWRAETGTQSAADSRPIPIGVTRDLEGGVQIRVGGRNLRSVAELAGLLPMQVINARGFDLLTGSPTDRRQYLDWGVFHVEQGYQDSWQRFQRAIKQRNTLLRRGKILPEELGTWDRELSRAGELIDEGRRAYFERLLPQFLVLAERLSPGLAGMELRYRRGWDAGQTLAEALSATATSDREQGYTHVGPQRADIKLLHEGHSAGETLSRGQQKLVVCALKLAQGVLFSQQQRRPCVYLVDDLPSELDGDHCGLVAEVLDELDAQVFITCVQHDEIATAWPAGGRQRMAMFHVEHGEVNGDAK